MKIAIPKEISPDEQRVALVPRVAQELLNANFTLVMEKNAGEGADYVDADYPAVEWVDSAQALYQDADIILKVQAPTEAEIALCKSGAIIIAFLNPQRYPERVQALKNKNITSFAMEYIPRISRAQSMDALSSQASIAGYKATLIAANNINRFFPMLTTAAGTIRPVNVLIIGTGVAGLQAIATAKRLGAIVKAYDIRIATKEQVESLGATMIDIGIEAEAAGGYARELTAEEKQKQHNALANAVAKSEVIICTAQIPGKPAPKIITEQMVLSMSPGSVIVDLAAETGGNCELTKPGEVVNLPKVSIHGPLNVPSLLSRDASNMYARNVVNFMKLLVTEGKINLDWQDPIIAQSVLTHDGEIKERKS